MVKTRSRESEETCKRGEDDNKWSTTTGGYVVKTLEVHVWKWEEEEEEEGELLYNKIAYKKMNKGLSKNNKVVPHSCK
jgi:hypothetical protein